MEREELKEWKEKASKNRKDYHGTKFQVRTLQAMVKYLKNLLKQNNIKYAGVGG